MTTDRGESTMAQIPSLTADTASVPGNSPSGASGASGSGRPQLSEVTVVIICHDLKRWPFLEAAVTGVITQGASSLIIGVDHNPELEGRIRAQWPHVPVVPNRHQRGASGTRNSAAELVTTRFIAFLDDDVVAWPHWLERLLEVMVDPTVVGAGGRVVPMWQGSAPRWFPEEFGWVIGTSFKGLPVSTSPIRNVWGGNMIARRDAFEAVGGFRTTFGKVGDRARPEDTELCIRMSAVVPGGHWMYVPEAEVGHQVPAARTRIGYFVNRSYHEGRGKVELDDLSGEDDVLADERSYLTRTLPAGIRDGVVDAVRGDAAGLARAGAIAVGVAAAGIGAAAGRVASRRERRGANPVASSAAPARPPAADAEGARAALGLVEPPIWVGELDLEAGPAELAVEPGYAWARILPRTGFAVGQPVIVPVRDGRVLATEVVAACGAWEPDATLRSAPQIPDGLSLAVTVGTRNRPEQLRRMLDSLARVEAPVTILVVDNAPSDDATRLVVEAMAARDGRIRYILEPRPGLSVARNRALRETGADVLLYTDDDVEVDENWIRVHAAAFADPRVTVSTGQAFAARLDVRDELLSEMTVAWGKGSQPRSFSLADPPADLPIFPFSPAMLGGGLNFAVRVDVARAIGGFDETLGAGSPMRGGEDCDFMIRAVRRGGVIRYSPNAFVWHHHRREPGDFDKQRLDSGVGLGAYLAKLATEPAALVEMARRLPAGLRHFGTLRSTAAGAGVDSRQRSTELKLTARGALGYHRARRAVRAAGGHAADRPLSSIGSTGQMGDVH
ncbi:MAG: glycosyltransferase [Kineosporiaceae bacterium]|nr:glycosyltransferase [Kineosporiaceae bacterium]